MLYHRGSDIDNNLNHDIDHDRIKHNNRYTTSHHNRYLDPADDILSPEVGPKRKRESRRISFILYEAAYRPRFSS